MIDSTVDGKAAETRKKGITMKKQTKTTKTAKAATQPKVSPDAAPVTMHYSDEQRGIMCGRADAASFTTVTGEVSCKKCLKSLAARGPVISADELCEALAAGGCELYWDDAVAPILRPTDRKSEVKPRRAPIAEAQRLEDEGWIAEVDPGEVGFNVFRVIESRFEEFAHLYAGGPISTGEPEPTFAEAFSAAADGPSDMAVIKKGLEVVAAALDADAAYRAEVDKQVAELNAAADAVDEWEGPGAGHVLEELQRGARLWWPSGSSSLPGTGWIELGPNEQAVPVEVTILNELRLSGRIAETSKPGIWDLAPGGDVAAAAALLATIAPPPAAPQPAEPKPAAPAKKPAGPAAGAKQQKVFGHSIAAVVRWMGREGFSEKEAKAALASHGIDTEGKNIVRSSLGAGRPTSPRYDAGAIPTLSADEAKQLRVFKASSLEAKAS
jgi:hypothetical protein